MSTCSGVQSDSPSSDLTLVDLREAIRWSIPSAFTLSSLLAGLSAVRFASEADFNSSIVCVLLAAIFDGLDGHVARYLGACSKIGFELDTLCDLANFGVTPAFVVFFWAKTPPAVECNHGKCPRENAVLWLACLCYAACCAFRLARFNVAGHAAEMDKQHLESRPGQRPPVQKACERAHGVVLGAGDAADSSPCLCARMPTQSAQDWYLFAPRSLQAHAQPAFPDTLANG
mmetsp:Transcript_122568/g.381555  ORF Transcript_122568/g.381555 Transcript_122568/m.381555 type:complete len:230 (+) Transcript_122568:113-802(+)